MWGRYYEMRIPPRPRGDVLPTILAGLGWLRTLPGHMHIMQGIMQGQGCRGHAGAWRARATLTAHCSNGAHIAEDA